MTARRGWAIAFWAYLALYSAVHAAFLVKTAYLPAENDFLGILAIGRGLDWGNPASFHNDFFAAGLPIVLSVLPAAHVFALSASLSLACAALTLAATYSIVTRLAGRAWAVAAAVVLSVIPVFVDYAASAGPDLIGLGLSMLAIAWFVRESQVRPGAARWWVLSGAGLLFGVAALVRYHALILGVSLLVWSLLAGRDRARGMTRLIAPAWALLGMLVGFAPQMILNVLGGYSLVQTGSAFYVYESALGMDWYTTSSLDPASYSSVLGVVRAYPLQVASGYLTALTNYVLPVAALLTGTLLASRARASATRAVLLALLIATGTYAVVVSIASSPRGPIAALPAMVIGLAVTVYFVSAATEGRLGRAGTATAVLVVLVIAWPMAREDVFLLQEKASAAATRSSVEADVLAQGTVASAGEILTNDFDLYFNALPGNLPDHIGGWQNISLNGNSPHTDVDMSSVVAFQCSARKRGISVVLWRESQPTWADAGLSGALNGASTSSRLINEGRIGPYVVTRIADTGDC